MVIINDDSLMMKACNVFFISKGPPTHSRIPESPIILSHIQQAFYPSSLLRCVPTVLIILMKACHCFHENCVAVFRLLCQL